VGARRGAWADSKCGAAAVFACARVKTPGARLLSAAEAMPREQGSMATCRVEYSGVHGRYGGDMSGWAAAWSARRHLCARGVWHKGRGSGRRFGTGGPTARGPADGSRPRRPGPPGVRVRGLAPTGARRRAGARSGTETFRGCLVRLLFSPKS
jgi:hypothetical protein